MTNDALLQLQSLSASYGTSRVVHDISLEVRAREIFCLLGRSGAGKTSTVRAIMRAGINRTGTVIHKGKDISKLPTEAIANDGIAWVPDDRRVFARLTVRQNLELGTTAAKHRGGGRSVDELCADLRLLEPILKRRGDQLSGGQQQIVSVARALASRPSVLLLDEPMEGLAPVIVAELADIIKRIPQNFEVAVVLVEENISLARQIGDRAMVLKVGHPAYTGSIQELFADQAQIQSLLGLGDETVYEPHQF